MMVRKVVQTSVHCIIVGSAMMLLSCSGSRCDGDEHSEQFMLCAMGNDSAFRGTPIMSLGATGGNVEDASILDSIIRTATPRPALAIHDEAGAGELSRLSEYISQSKHIYNHTEVKIAVHPDFLQSAEAFKEAVEDRGGDVTVRVPPMFGD